MAKSLRWRLQVFHAAILSCVVLGFGTALSFRCDEPRQATSMPSCSRAHVSWRQRCGRCRLQVVALGRLPYNAGHHRARPGDPFAEFDPPPNQRRRDELLALPPSMTIRRRPEEKLPYFVVFGPRGEIIAGTSTDLIEVPVRPINGYDFRHRWPVP